MYLVLTVGGNEKEAREGAALKIFFLPCGPLFWIKMGGPHLYLLIVVLKTAPFSVDENTSSSSINFYILFVGLILFWGIDSFLF